MISFLLPKYYKISDSLYSFFINYCSMYYLIVSSYYNVKNLSIIGAGASERITSFVSCSSTSLNWDLISLKINPRILGDKNFI